ncbi:MAG TPA: hypothetical protein VIK86_04700 [Candidatus Paceibacterota bacterium]
MNTENFYDGIITKLKEEANLLNRNLSNLHTDMNSYMSNIKALRETLDIIQRYNWELKYSEYSTEVSSGVLEKQVAVWEQNIAGDIRNHKKWKVESPTEM